MAFLPIDPKAIFKLFGVDEEAFLIHYAIPIEQDNNYTDKISIYNYFIAHNIIYQNIRMATARYEAWVNEIKADIENKYHSIYLKIQSGQPYIYDETKYVKSSAKESGIIDDNGNMKVSMDADITKSISKKLAEMSINNGKSYTYNDIIRYRDSFKHHLQSIIEVGKTMEMKLMAYSNDLKFMSGGR